MPRQSCPWRPPDGRQHSWRRRGRTPVRRARSTARRCPRGPPLQLVAWVANWVAKWVATPIAIWVAERFALRFAENAGLARQPAEARAGTGPRFSPRARLCGKAEAEAESGQWLAASARQSFARPARCGRR